MSVDDALKILLAAHVGSTAGKRQAVCVSTVSDLVSQSRAEESQGDRRLRGSGGRELMKIVASPPYIATLRTVTHI